MEGITMRTAGDARVALRGVRMHATLVGLAQRTLVEQTFVNAEPRAVEAVYTFPLPDGAAVAGFEVVTGDRVLTGTVDENDAAVEKYESAVADGDAAFMAEQDRPDVFTVRVGNLKPRQAATVRLTVVRPVEVVDNTIRLAFPTTIAPRFTTDSGTNPIDAAVDGDALNPPHVLDVPYGLTLTVDLNLGRPVRGVTSPTHAVTVTTTGVGRRVSLADAAMDREVVLSIALAGDVGTTVQAERGPDGAAYLAVTFAPEFATAGDAPPPPAEVAFVLDCSGSMQGESIQQATAALELCLRTLNAGDTFNVCRFGSDFELMSPEPVPYTDDTLSKAVAYVRASTGDLGGTEILAPLEAVLRTPPPPGRTRTVVLLTDGQVSNEPAVIALARRHRERNRIFPFGIGPAVSTFLVNGLARATGGVAEFIKVGERIESKVLRTFARAGSPTATDVTLDWGGADVQTLAELPPVFDGERLSVFGRCAGQLPDTVSLRCRTAAGDQSWPADVPTALPSGTTVATTWARRAIQSLEEVNGVGRSARLTPGTREAAEVVRLSKTFGVLSSLTSFVAVEHRTPAERNEGRPALRRVPVMLATGWGGVDAALAGGGGAVFACAAPVPAPMQAAPGGLRGIFKKAMPARRRSAPLSPPSAVPVPDTAMAKPSHDTPEGSTILDWSLAEERSVSATLEVSTILVCQTAAGGFDWSDELDAAAAGRVPDWGRRWSDAVGRLGATADGSLIGTVKALVLLRTAFDGDQPVWRRAAAKAVRFLAEATGRPTADVTAWLAAV